MYTSRRSPSRSLWVSQTNINFHDGPLASPSAVDESVRQQRYLVRFIILVISAFGSLIAFSWALDRSPALVNSRLQSAPLIVSRDFQAVPEAYQDGSPNEVVLILCPMKNAIEHIWHFFHLIDSLEYPRSLIHIGILVSDSQDRTYERAHELALERQKRFAKKNRYGEILVFRKNFVESEEEGALLENKGKERHDFDIQIRRRTVLAKSRSWLLSSALSPEVDWVLWLDVDVVEYRPTLLTDLIGWGKNQSAQIISPNCVWRTYDDIGPYDRNTWQETKESIEMKKKLKPSDILIEGYESRLDTHRYLLASAYFSSTPRSSAPDVMKLDGVGGCCTMVNASIHRQGAVFPAYAFNHQIETEGFAQMVKRLGGKLIGLPKYHVLHGLYG